VACDPQHSVLIEACAGSDKTWLLVSRMLRLLLTGTKPEELLAITFTRKAAQEMRERLLELLHELALAEEDSALAILQQRGLNASEAKVQLPAARGLYQRVLSSPYGLSVDTFHSWFARLLQIAPLNAGVPHGYALEENAEELIDMAWVKFTQTLNQTEMQALREALVALVQLYGGLDVLDRAEVIFKDWPEVMLALAQLRWLATHVHGHQVSIDLADLRGAAYYSGPRFAVFVPEASDALVRGGRYDEVGALFGRKRPAAGFSLDIKALVSLIQRPVAQAAIRAPWGEDAGLHQAISQLRQQGHTVVCMLPGHDSEVDEFHCDRELVLLKGQWILQPLAST